jgi:hypothetical protein
MKKYLIPFFLLIFASLTLMTTPSCRVKSGCPSNQQVQPKVNKKGELKMTRNKKKSELFDKKRRKRMKH